MKKCFVSFEMVLKLFIISVSIIPLLNVNAVDYCSLPCFGDYGEEENSACNCAFGGDCASNARELPPDEPTKNFIVELHNKYRERVASGQEGKLVASNMAMLVYDEDLEHVAQCHANKCKAGHDRCRRTEKFQYVGQNVAKTMGYNCDIRDTLEMAFQMWFDEIKQASADCMSSYSGCSGHYTQMVWAETTSIGCGRVQSGSMCFLVCNYGPAGNMREEPVFKRGKPSCETDEKYPHLCKTKLSGSSSSGRLSFSKSLYNIPVFIPIIYFKCLLMKGH